MSLFASYYHAGLSTLEQLYTSKGVLKPKARHRTRAWQDKATGKIRTMQYTIAETVDNEADVRTGFQVCYPDHVPHAGGPVCLRLKVYVAPPKYMQSAKWKREIVAREQWIIHKKPDADNLLKTFMDGLNGVAWKDDALVSPDVIRIYSNNPRVEASIEYYEQWTKESWEAFCEMVSES